MAATRRFAKVQHGKICCLLSVSMLCKRKQCWTLSALRSVLGRLYWNTVQNGGQWLHTWTTRCPFSVSQLSSEDVQRLRTTVNKVQPNVAHHTRWDRLISLSFVCTSVRESIITRTLQPRAAGQLWLVHKVFKSWPFVLLCHFCLTVSLFDPRAKSH